MKKYISRHLGGLHTNLVSALRREEKIITAPEILMKKTKSVS